MASRVPTCRLAAFYLAYFSVLGVLVPYFPLYLEAAGFDAVGIGAVMAIIPATKIFSPGLWGWFADRRGSAMGLVRLASLFAFLAFLLILADKKGLAPMLWALGLFSFCWNATLPLFETVTLGHLPDAKAYGRIRMWGSIGFIGAVMVYGEFLEHWPLLSWLPELLMALLLVQVLVTLTIPERPAATQADTNASLRAILGRKSVLAFFLAATLLQLGHGPYYSFFSLYLKQLGYPDDWIGALWALGVIAEILLFLILNYAPFAASSRSLLLMSLSMALLRWSVMALGARQLELLILAQTLHAATFGCAHLAAIGIVHRHFKGPHHAKGQAFYSGICYGLGGALGSLLGGKSWSLFGGETTFALVAGLSGLGFLLALLWVERPQKASIA